MELKMVMEKYSMLMDHLATKAIFWKVSRMVKEEHIMKKKLKFLENSLKDFPVKTINFLKAQVKKNLNDVISHQNI